MLAPLITREKPPRRPEPEPDRPKTAKTLDGFIESNYERRPGCAVEFNSFCRRFWKYLDAPEAPFNWFPDKLRRELEREFPVGWIFKRGLAIGNLSGAEGITVSNRELVAMFSMLVPRDLTHGEMIVARGEVESSLRHPERKLRPVETMSATAG